MAEREWTAYRLAKESGLSHSTISNMFSRHTAPSVPTLEAICQGFGITLSQFFAETDDMVELTDEQLAMFQKWSKLTRQQKKLMADLIEQLK
ncbi:MAG: helix-turn-helix transcriptional regulator [Lachnospiraceae bacterium]|nr:helix-turn-helix transcriptional regulator [Lachnospiraceae bacterium]